MAAISKHIGQSTIFLPAARCDASLPGVFFVTFPCAIPGKDVNLQKIKYSMGKLAFILCFILSVFPADAEENRRHIHVVKRGSKKSHRGNTVAKIWIEQNGEKKIEIAWSELSSSDEALIISAIDKYWDELNRKIDKVFAGEKIRIKNIR